MNSESEEVKQLFLNGYNEALTNAEELLKDARILLQEKSYARAYFLSFTALEEISKAVHLADVFTGFCTYEDFKKNRYNHEAKIERIKWAQDYANSYPNNLNWVGPGVEDFETIIIDQIQVEKREHALFVEINKETVIISTPKIKISFQDARSITHITETALQRIFLNTEYQGNQIGTKGFIK